VACQPKTTIGSRSDEIPAFLIIY
jgi:hypothetical protein